MSFRYWRYAAARALAALAASVPVGALTVMMITLSVVLVTEYALRKPLRSLATWL